jgi:hypothetical protein
MVVHNSLVTKNSNGRLQPTALNSTFDKKTSDRAASAANFTIQKRFLLPAQVSTANARIYLGTEPLVNAPRSWGSTR